MKRRTRCHSKLYVVAITVTLLQMLTACLYAQVVQDSSTVSWLGENTIQNVVHLEKFFEKLHQLKQTHEGDVNVLHIGDSHIQADFLTEVVRKNLQMEFGNAGRGLVVPLRVAGTNEPFNFRTYSDSEWTSKRVVHPSRPLPIGVGGITINTTDDTADFGLRMNDITTDYSFSRVALFFENAAESFDIAVRDSAANELAIVEAGVEAMDVVDISLPARYNHIRFAAKRRTDQQRHATIFGMNLRNGNPGILYHAVGVNGAKYEHYNTATKFVRHTAYLKPDLIIVSLGTNESVEYPRINEKFQKHISDFVSSLLQANPGAALMLITPPDAFLRKTKPNPGIESVRTKIIEFAVDNGFAFWDMYKVNGGKNSAVQWKMRGLLRPDGIHFSRDGYAQQGKLLFEAIMKGYNEYVSDRHP